MSDLRSGVRYDPIVVSAESTVVAEYVSESADEAAYQSEAALERGFISVLQSQAYEYLPLTSEAELIANLRAQLEALNEITFSDAEWERFFSKRIAGANTHSPPLTASPSAIPEGASRSVPPVTPCQLEPARAQVRRRIPGRPSGLARSRPPPVLR